MGPSVLTKVNAICKILEGQDDIKCGIDQVEKKDGEVANGGPKVNEFVKDGTSSEIDKVDQKGNEVADGGPKVNEFVKDGTSGEIDKVEKKDSEVADGGLKVNEFVKDDKQLTTKSPKKVAKGK